MYPDIVLMYYRLSSPPRNTNFLAPTAAACLPACRAARPLGTSAMRAASAHGGHGTTGAASLLFWCALLASAVTLHAATAGDSVSAQPRTASPGRRPSKPALGFNHCGIECCGPDMPSAQFLMATADAMVSRGLRDAGYEFINMDDCWMMPACDDGSCRTNNGTGHQIPVPHKFPHGIKAVADYMHARGLKFGLYTTFSSSTCGHGEGSPGFEFDDGKWYASQGRSAADALQPRLLLSS
jgi:alpha-galactosidase